MKERKNIIKVGDRVRVRIGKRVFKKAYKPSWTEELFTVSRERKTTPITFILKDDHGEELKGTFYKEEIQKVGDKTIFRIEKILDKRRKGLQTQYLVKWFGYPSSFDSWIPQSTLTTYSAD